jgi:hypothetical protein
MSDWVWGPPGYAYGYEPPTSWTRRVPVAIWYFVGWDCIQLGFHVCLSAPNIEIHVPFGFIRLGWLPPLRMARAGRIPRVSA